VDLLARARTGDTEALNALCARYLPRLQKWAHGRLPAWARGALDTHDLVQDTLAHVVQRLGSFEPRHESNRPDLGPSPIEEAIGSEALERYEAALQRLRPDDREAIIARIEMGHSYPDVAKALGKPTVAAAHVAVSRALVRLAKEMSIERHTRRS
jgi:RNA polymerase sigma-70 factor (ECF subfamily)